MHHTARTRSCTCTDPATPKIRGVCKPCYTWHQRRGLHLDLPAIKRRVADVADDYIELRDQGYTRAQIAERLGMVRTHLDQSLRRAALAGDTRIDYRPRAAAA